MNHLATRVARLFSVQQTKTSKKNKPNGGKTNQIFYENKPKINHFIKNKTP
jgi:hypothetical protein